MLVWSMVLIAQSFWSGKNVSLEARTRIAQTYKVFNYSEKIRTLGQVVSSKRILIRVIHSFDWSNSELTCEGVYWHAWPGGCVHLQNYRQSVLRYF
jgi:hypothetical protein